MNIKKLTDRRRVKDGLTRSERYNRNMDRIFANAERFNQNKMKWLRKQGVSEDEIQSAYRNTGLGKDGLYDLVIQVARENGDTRENSEIMKEAISDSRRVKDSGDLDMKFFYGKDTEMYVDIIEVDGDIEFHYRQYDLRDFIEQCNNGAEDMNGYYSFFTDYDRDKNIDCFGVEFFTVDANSNSMDGKKVGEALFNISLYPTYASQGLQEYADYVREHYS